MSDPLPPSFALVHDRVRKSAQASVSNGFHQLTFQAMSTVCRVNFHGVTPQLAQTVQSEVLNWIAWFEAHYSRFIGDSLIGRINAAAGLNWVEVDAETDALFNLCQEMVFFTRGVFDPTALPLIRLWNWKDKNPVVPTEEKIAEMREFVGWRKVQRRRGAIFLPVKGMCLDLGGIGKEYAVDRILMLAMKSGITNVLVDFGQDVRVHGQSPQNTPWHIGLDDPKHPGKCWTGVAVNDHAVATSGDYFRNFTADGRRYGHIVDPRTGYPVNNGCEAVSIIAPHCTMAGILSTTAFVLGAKEGLNLIGMCPGVEGAISTENGRVQTRNFYAFATK